ncbi:MAG: LuxR family transcriptional regulator [Pikeienuella sp.]|uniref:LuxR family transcriptional regulator n=1 Tax=Pikeienuella sp. TaxID=2831957 RepID=UPI00391CE800
MRIEDNPLESCVDAPALSGALERYAGGLGVSYYSYLLIRRPGGAEIAGSQTLLTNYPVEWTERYQRKLYTHYDPVALLTRRSRMPFFWDGGAFLKSWRKDQRRVFHEARSFGIVCGYSIPIAGPSGDVGVFSLIAGRAAHLDHATRDEGARLYVAALQTHDRMARLVGDGQPQRPRPVLSPRELECLKWTAEGMTSDEIADRLSLSPATVNYHLNKAIRKLEASNRHHATVIAVRCGWI